MNNSEILNDGIEKLKECPKCNSYYSDGMPFSLVGEPFKNGIRASYTKFECSRCETEFISFINYKQVLEAEPKNNRIMPTKSVQLKNSVDTFNKP